MRRRLVIPTVVLFPIIALLVSACTTIQPGSVGIKVDLLGESREVENVEVVVGRVFYNPMTTKVIEYPYIVQRFEWWGEESLKFNSTEGVRIAADVSISLGIDPDHAAALYVKYRKTLQELIDNEIRDRVNGCMNRAGATMSVDNIIGEGRTDFINQTIVCIEQRIVAEGFTLNDLQLTNNFELPPNIQARIDEQIQAQQAAVAAENTVRQREAEAQQRIAQAQGEAQARLLEAEAEAEALRVQGDALRANPEVLMLTYLEQWDGVLPVVAGGDAPFILDLNSLMQGR